MNIAKEAELGGDHQDENRKSQSSIVKHIQLNQVVQD